MKISIALLLGDPIKRQDSFVEAIKCWHDFADELLIMTRFSKDWIENEVKTDLPRLRVISVELQEEFTYQQIVKINNLAITEATGDIFARPDLDWFIHENDFKPLKEQLEKLNKPLASLQKMSVYFKGMYYQKGGQNIFFNRKQFKDKALMGMPIDKGEISEYIWKTEDIKNGFPLGSLVDDMERTGISLWNFDYTFKDKEACKRSFYYLSQARKKAYGFTKWGETPDECFNYFINLMKGRLRKSILSTKDYSIFPKYVRESYKNISSDKFGFNGFNLI